MRGGTGRKAWMKFLIQRFQPQCPTDRVGGIALEQGVEGSLRSRRASGGVGGVGS